MGCNPDILENIVQRAGGPRDIYFPIYPDYNPCTNIIHRRKIVHKTDILANISVLCYNISEYQGQRTLVFYFYPMYNFGQNFVSGVDGNGKLLIKAADFSY